MTSQQQGWRDIASEGEGVTTSGSGCQPTASAADASSQSGIPDAEPMRCNFCAKTQHEVRKLIAGATAFICDECVVLCDEIVNRDAWEATIHRLTDFANRNNMKPTLSLIGELAWVLGLEPEFNLKPRAQGIEARQGRDGNRLDPKDESPVADSDASTPCSPSPRTGESDDHPSA